MPFVFPPVELADEYGLLGIGANLEVETIISAYKSGIFPWPITGINEIPWFSPPERAIIYLDDFKLSTRSLRQLKNSDYQVRVNTNFQAVIENCSTPRVEKRNIDVSSINKGKNTITRSKLVESWITEDLKNAYISLHDCGYAHSIEVYENEDLVGGLYGVKIGNFFAAESMFRTKNNASKLAVFALVELLKQSNSSWIDCQVITPHLKSWGAKVINRDNYLKLLDDELAKPSIDLPKGVIHLFR